MSCRLTRMIRQQSRQNNIAMFALFPGVLNHANKRPQVDYFANPASGTGNGIVQNISFLLQYCDLRIHHSMREKGLI